MESRTWILCHNNKSVGPLTLEQLQHLLKTGQVDGNAVVRRAEDENWIRLSQVTELQHLSIPKTVVDQRGIPSRNPLTLYLIATACGTVVFASLWAVSIASRPSPVVKTIEVEKIREVPKEVIKEVVRSPTFDERNLIALGNMVQNAPFYSIDDPEAAKRVFNVPAVTVRVLANDAITRHISRQQIKDRVEMQLRQNDIDVKESSLFYITVEFFGMEGGDLTAYTYRISASEPVLLRRFVVGSDPTMTQVSATIWEVKGLAISGNNVIETQILKTTDLLTLGISGKLVGAKVKQ